MKRIVSGTLHHTALRGTNRVYEGPRRERSTCIVCSKGIYLAGGTKYPGWRHLDPRARVYNDAPEVIAEGRVDDVRAAVGAFVDDMLAALTKLETLAHSNGHAPLVEPATFDAIRQRRYGYLKEA